MRKVLLYLISLSFMSVLIIGCQSTSDSRLLDQEFLKISISKSGGFSKVNTDFFAVYEDGEALDVFQDALASAVKRAGIADMMEPEFDIKVIHTDKSKHGYHLWVGEKGQKSILMPVDDTHTTFTLPEEITARLIDLIDE